MSPSGTPSPEPRSRPLITAQDRLNFLAEASEILASSLDYETTLASVARLAVPTLGDWCAVDVCAEGGAIQRLAVAHIDPEKVAWAHELQRNFPPDPDSPTGVPNVIRTGQPEFYPHIPDEVLVSAAKNEEQLRIIREIGFTSVMVLPLVARDRVLGAITLVTAESAWNYNDEDLKLGQDLARRAAVAVDNALLYRNAHLQQERLQVTLNSIGDAVISTDTEGRITFMNPVAVSLTGWESVEAIGRPLEEVFVIMNQLTMQPVENPVQKVLREGTIVGLANHTVLVNKKGEMTPIDDSAAPIRDAYGKMLGVVMVFHDVTERYRSESALRESEGRFRTMADSAPVLIWMSDTDGTFNYFNKTWLEFTGRTMEQEMGTGWTEAIHPDDRRQFMEMYGSSFKERKPFRMEYRMGHAGGEYRWVLNVGVPRFTDSGEFAGFIGSSIDIHDRREAEEALRRSENQLRLVIDAAPLLISYIDAEGRYTFTNRTYEDWFNPRQNHINGRYLVDVIGEKAYATIRPRMEAALSGEEVTFESVLQYNPNDRRHVRASYVPDVAEDGSVRGFVAVVHDISQQKRTELELSQAKEAAEAANQAKDQFLAVLSHELRTPLTPVLTIVDALEGDPSLPEDLQPYMEMIRRNVELEARLIDDLLDINRIIRGKLELERHVVDVHPLLESVLENYHVEMERKGVELRVELDAERHHVRADAARLQQVFGNLMQNALKFTPEGGEVVVRTTSSDDDMFVLSVADTGIGIEPELLSRIFNAFEQGEQTITRRFGGLGLGLTVSKSLIDMHGGRISVQSQGRDRGATFIVELKTVAETGENESPETSPENGLEDAEPERLRVLLVDDHEDTSTVLKLLLERQGYRVRTAATVGDAVKAAEHGFDILVSDIGLPDGSGLDLMRILKEKGPVKGIALSGFGMEQDVQRSRDAGFMEHLTKPVSFQKLREAITRLLDPSS